MFIVMIIREVRCMQELEIPYTYCNGRLTVEVRLQYPSDIFLVDSLNFRKYKAGENFKFYGGHYDYSPVYIRIIGYGPRYLIVRGKGKYQYRFL